MATSTPNLAIVLCHGSYHTPAPYTPLLDAFKSRGIDAYCPQLPTADLAKLDVGDVGNPDFDRAPPEGGYPQGEEDAQVVLKVLKPLVEEGKNVLLLAHSAGGWVATEVARPELQAKRRAEKGLSGGIMGIFYMGAFVIPVGESVNTFFQPKDGNFVTPPFMTFHKHGAAGLGTMVEPEKYLFNDVDTAIAKKYAAGLTASPILTTKLSNDAYSALPCAYLILEGDLTLPKEYQEGMAALQGSKSGEFSIYRCPAGHSAHLSWTEGVVDTAIEFMKKIRA